MKTKEDGKRVAPLRLVHRRPRRSTRVCPERAVCRRGRSFPVCISTERDKRRPHRSIYHCVVGEINRSGDEILRIRFICRSGKSAASKKPKNPGVVSANDPPRPPPSTDARKLNATSPRRIPFVSRRRVVDWSSGQMYGFNRCMESACQENPQKRTVPIPLAGVHVSSADESQLTSEGATGIEDSIGTKSPL